MRHPLLGLLSAAASGDFPDADGGVTFVPPLAGGLSAVVSFTGHAVVATSLGPRDLIGFELDGFGGALAPATLLLLARGGRVGVIDITLVARGIGGGQLPRTDTWDDHPRVRYARSIRADVAVHGDERGFVTIADGLAGRREMSIELAAPEESRGTGRQLIAAARGLVPSGEWLFAAVSPGNARSLRAFLSQGFVPIGSEVLLSPESA